MRENKGVRNLYIDQYANIRIATVAQAPRSAPVQRLHNRRRSQNFPAARRGRPIGKLYLQGSSETKIKVPDTFLSDTQPDDIFLVIEVADTSIALDRGTKLPLYAKARISEVWIVDLTGRTVETYWHASAQGYEGFSQLNDSGQVTSQVLTALNIPVREILS